MSRPFFVGSYLQVTWWALGQWKGRKNASNDNKQILDAVEHDIMNYQNRGLCYLPKPNAEADNTDTRF